MTYICKHPATLHATHSQFLFTSQRSRIVCTLGMSSNSSALPSFSCHGRGSYIPLSVRFQYALSARRLRVLFMVGAFLLLAGVLVRYDEHVARLPTQFRQFTKHNPPPMTGSLQCSMPITDESIVWSDFAYVQYVTNSNYLCNSLMIFEALRRHGTRADLLMLYPQMWKVPKDVLDDDAPPIEYEGKLLAQARDQYHAKLNPIQVRTYVNEKDATWQDSYTKLLAWNQTQYKRVISLDSDATLLNVRTSPRRQAKLSLAGMTGVDD